MYTIELEKIRTTKGSWYKDPGVGAINDVILTTKGWRRITNRRIARDAYGGYSLITVAVVSKEVGELEAAAKDMVEQWESDWRNGYDLKNTKEEIDRANAILAEHPRRRV